jgi:FMN phosphatase YigB (HAD superfamily)
MRTSELEAAERDRVVSVLDVDNTLLDNDQVTAHLREHLLQEFGAACRDQYFAIFEQLREELGYADYLGALQRYRLAHMHESRVPLLSAFLVDYPFADRLYPGALAVLARLKKAGPVVILTDGDVVFQPRKILRSGLYDAVDSHVLIYIHKELELENVAECYPAERYVFVDDKVRILAAVKQAWGPRVTTVFPRQGHYALDPELVARYPPADVTVERIGDLLELELPGLS